ncbi:hypothetical protein [Terriglobus sp.]|uniref:hypothetical protein n=1 Tax=Terriglobus sp. TaxID=1889013 RepID=UPI003AFF7F0E
MLRKSAVFIWQNPVVLLPVLLARVVDFAIYWVCGLAKGPAMKAVAPRSVLGGYSGKVNGAVLLLAALFTFLPLICEVALLLYAMVVSGRWAHAIRETGSAEGKTWEAPASGVARTGLLSLSVGAVTAVVGLYFTLHGGVPVRWSYLVTWCFLILASWFLAPSWLRLLAQVEGVRFRDTSKIPPFVAVALGLTGFAACIYLGGAVQHSLESAHRIHGAVVLFAINLVAACLSAIPLAFSFVAMSRYVAERPGWTTE